MSGSLTVKASTHTPRRLSRGQLVSADFGEKLAAQQEEGGERNTDDNEGDEDDGEKAQTGAKLHFWTSMTFTG